MLQVQLSFSTVQIAYKIVLMENMVILDQVNVQPVLQDVLLALVALPPNAIPVQLMDLAINFTK